MARKNINPVDNNNNADDDNKKPRSAKKVKISGAAKTPKSKPHRGKMRTPNNVGKVVEFKALWDEVEWNVPAALSASPAARIKMFREITSAARAAKAAGKIKPAISIELPWNMLDFAEVVGRESRCNLDNVANIVGDFHDHMYADPRVAMLPVYDTNGKLITVYFYVGDAWHRTRSLMELYYRNKPENLRQVKTDVLDIQCQVTAVKDMIEVAQMFSAQNSPKHSKPVRCGDQWRPRAIAADKDPRAKAVIELAAKYGFDILCRPGVTGATVFSNGSTVENLMFDFPNIGIDVVERAFMLLSDKTLISVYKRKEMLAAQIFGGLCFFLAYFERPGYAHDYGIRHMLSLETFLSSLSATLPGMSEEVILRHVPGVRSLKREENKRFLSYAAAMAVIYKLHVPEPLTRGGFWKKCPAQLRALIHTAPTQVVDVRNNYVANLQTKLEQVGKPCYTKWRKVYGKSITR